MRIDVIISVPRQRHKALPRFCIVAFRLSSKKIKTLTYSDCRVWVPRSLVAAFPSVVEQVVQDYDILVAAVGSLHCVVSKFRGTGSSGSRHFWWQRWDPLELKEVRGIYF